MIVVSSDNVAQVLASGNVIECCELCSLTSAEAQKDLCDIAERVSDREAWRDALLADLNAYREEDITFSHRPDELACEDALYRALIAVLRIPDIYVAHRNLGISAEITTATAADVALHIEDYIANNGGRTGVKTVAWLRAHFGGRVFRIGRLHFIGKTMVSEIIVLEHKEQKNLVVLAADGLRLRSDGVCLAGDDDPSAWIAHIERTQKTICGNEVSPIGVVAKTRTTFDVCDYSVVVDENSMLLDVHIPADGPLDLDVCKKSIRDAVEFFKRLFPKDDYVGFVTRTWFLDNQLPELLPPTSNVVRWQKQWHRFPMREDSVQCCQRVFGCAEPDIDTAPTKTSMQRSLLAFLRKGGRFHAQAGFIPINE